MLQRNHRSRILPFNQRRSFKTKVTSGREKEERNYQIDIQNKDIPNDIKEVNNEIIAKVIECEHKGNCNEQCTEAFKIIPDELSFYQRMNLPIPHLCPNCRHYNRLKQRNPLKLWYRKCMKPNCPNEFETSYAPDRLEIVYCERCLSTRGVLKTHLRYEHRLKYYQFLTGVLF